MRRNDIVIPKKTDGPWWPYGRIIRRVDSEHVEVVDCGRYVIVYRDDDLNVVKDYKGYTDNRGRFWRMPTLRKLKALCRQHSYE